MKITAIIGTATAAIGLAACASTVAPSGAPTLVPTVAPTISPSVTPTVDPTLTPTLAPIPTATAVAPTPTATPVAPVPLTHVVITAQTTCQGEWSASVRAYGFQSGVLYYVSVTDNLPGFESAGGQGIPVGPGGLYPTPTDGTPVWGEGGGGGIAEIGGTITATISSDAGHTASATMRAPEDCLSPKLIITTACASPGDGYPDGDVAFRGGIDGMLFEMYGPETDGSFPALGQMDTDIHGDVDDASIGAGLYEYAYVMPDTGPGVIEGSFTVAACAP